MDKIHLVRLHNLANVFQKRVIKHQENRVVSPAINKANHLLKYYKTFKKTEMKKKFRNSEKDQCELQPQDVEI